MVIFFFVPFRLQVVTNKVGIKIKKWLDNLNCIDNIKKECGWEY